MKKQTKLSRLYQFYLKKHNQGFDLSVALTVNENLEKYEKCYVINEILDLCLIKKSINYEPN